jgi:hypothetical protein
MKVIKYPAQAMQKLGLGSGKKISLGSLMRMKKR